MRFHFCVNIDQSSHFYKCMNMIRLKPITYSVSQNYALRKSKLFKLLTFLYQQNNKQISLPSLNFGTTLIYLKDIF